LIGLGVSAISQIGDLYCQNYSDLNQYQNSLASAQLATSRGLLCNADDRLRRAVIAQLICTFSLEFAQIEHAFNIDFQGYFGALWPQLQGMAEDGLIELDSEKITVLPAGRLLVRSVCMVFDAYLEQQNRQRFSRVI
jgi:oxygen-independent coproporphyrinogen-3 oxidase